VRAMTSSSQESSLPRATTESAPHNSPPDW
jgi:hypothetical protein